MNKLSEKVGAVALALSIVATVSLVATDLLNSWGVFFAGSDFGFFADVAIQLGYRAVFVFSVMLSIRALIKRRRLDKAYIALAIQVVSFTLLGSGVLQRQVERWNFESRLSRRAEVVELARQGKLPSRLRGSCDCFYADLPVEYANVSAGREVLVSRHSGGFSVLFFVARTGMFNDDDYSAFVFREDDSEPRTGEEDTDSFYEVRALRQHWFFVRHT